jgi:hypothetical protein
MKKLFCIKRLILDLGNIYNRKSTIDKRKFIITIIYESKYSESLEYKVYPSSFYKADRYSPIRLAKSGGTAFPICLALDISFPEK